MYGQLSKAHDVNEARYNKLVMMSGKFSQVDNLSLVCIIPVNVVLMTKVILTYGKKPNLC